MKKGIKIGYWIATGLLTALMLMSVFAYLTSFDEVAVTFTSLGYSPDIIYPLAAAKVLGLIALWWDKWNFITVLAYLAFAVDMTLALIGHIKVGDDKVMYAVVGLLFLVLSFFFRAKKRSAA